MLALGIMSGTSCDGADALLLAIDSLDERGEPTILGRHFVPYPDELQAELARPAELRVPRISELHFLLPGIYERAARGIDGWDQAQVVGCHGQTLWHAPPSSGAEVSHTFQVGSGSALAQRLGLPVVSDLRAADMVHGGEGAPIAPVGHWFFTPPEHDGRMVVNIGGIANVTHVTPRLEDVWASDVGPGGMIADALASGFSGGRLSCDRDGELSAAGTARTEVVQHILSHGFFARPFPRSTGREDFGLEYVDGLRARFPGVAVPDLIRSALVATAEAIVRAARERGATGLLLSGGGANNPTLVDAITERASGIPVTVAQDGAFAPQNHEPAAMALIAARTLSRKPSSLPGVTGASRAVILGSISWP